MKLNSNYLLLNLSSLLVVSPANSSALFFKVWAFACADLVKLYLESSSAAVGLY